MGQLDHPQTSNELRLIGVPEKLARVCCRVRKMPQQPCDGTCGDCKKNFNNYITETVRIMQSGTGQPTGLGPDEEPPLSSEEAKKIITQRLRDWIERKRGMIANSRNSHAVVEIRNKVNRIATELH